MKGTVNKESWSLNMSEHNLLDATKKKLEDYLKVFLSDG